MIFIESKELKDNRKKEKSFRIRKILERINVKSIKKFKGYLFILPSLIGFSIFYIIPFFSGIKYSLLRSGFDKTFVGFQNYLDIINSQAFRLALKNNVVFMIIGIPLAMVLSFVIALIIDEIDASRYIKLAIILPIAIPSAITSGFFRKVFGTGLENVLSSKYAMIAVIIIYIWRSIGYNLIIYLATLTHMDKSIIEASKIDGSSYLQRVRHIIIPLTTPTTVFVFIVSIINSFKVFKDVFILQGSYPNQNIYMLQHYMNNVFRNLRYQSLTAASYIFAIIIFTFAGIFFYIDKRFTKKLEGENIARKGKI